jgi:hypothetical protein
VLCGMQVACVCAVVALVIAFIVKS